MNAFFERTIALILGNLFLFVSVSSGEGESDCGYRNPPLYRTFNTLPPVHSGVQAILPQHKFHCDGLLNEILVQVMGESSRLDVQIWRPTKDTHDLVYSLIWSSTFSTNDGSSNRGSTSSPPYRVDNIVWYPIPNGVPVKEGDVLGYYIEQNSNPIRVGYFDTSTVESGVSNSVVSSLEGVDAPLCNMSLCDSSLKSLHHTSPLIHADLGKLQPPP